MDPSGLRGAPQAWVHFAVSWRAVTVRRLGPPRAFARSARSPFPERHAQGTLVRMATSSQPPRVDDADKLDWTSLRDVARRCLRARLGGFSATDLDDAVQEACERMLKFVRRRGLPDSPVGLMLCIVHAVSADAIKCRQRERQLRSGEVRTWLVEPDDRPDKDKEDEVLEEYREIVEIVRGYFQLRRAGCVPIADALSRGELLKTYAARNQESYTKVRKAWSRCQKFIHDAIDKRRLRLKWPRPAKRPKQPRKPDA
jgi:hypothetical protein